MITKDQAISDQPLWIYDSGLNTAAIETGVIAAVESLSKAGVTAESALRANLARANDEPFNAAHAEAWDDAERAALVTSNAGEHASLAAA